MAHILAGGKMPSVGGCHKNSSCKGTLNAHDQNRVTVFAYSAGSVRDWVTEEIQAATQFRDVAGLDDAALAALIRQDEIDVLIDLSGHTGGSRLTVFAHRPSPAQFQVLFPRLLGCRVLRSVPLYRPHEMVRR